MSKIPAGIPSLSPESLNGGMDAFRSFPEWDHDFHANFYCELHADMQTHGFTPKWWDSRVNNLSKWIAIRSRTPITKDEILETGADYLDDLKREYNRITDNGKNVNIEYCTWEDVKPLFDIAMKIKPTQSPVFASKLCHFILPELFPVFDRTALQGASKFLQLKANLTTEDYQKYWECCRALWMQCTCKQELEGILRTEIKVAGGNAEHYPWASRIPEICLMNIKSS